MTGNDSEKRERFVSMPLKSFKLRPATADAFRDKCKDEGQTQGAVIREALERMLFEDLVPRNGQSRFQLQELARRMGVDEETALDIAIANYYRAMVESGRLKSDGPEPGDVPGDPPG